VRSRTCKSAGGEEATIYPIQFGVPEQDVVACVPAKSRAFATIVPGKLDTYIFKLDYRKSYFALTTRKAGWDCMRHYEILASGSLPFFPDIENAPVGVMSSLPKELLLKARSLPGKALPFCVKCLMLTTLISTTWCWPGIQDLDIDLDVFDRKAYYELACRALEYTRSHLTTRAVASYVLEAMGVADARRVLMLSASGYDADYMRDTVMHGLRELKGLGFTEYPK
jgi:hypothetical protein